MSHRAFDASRQTAADALGAIAARMPDGVHAQEFSLRAKIPFKVALYRGALLRRIEELGREALAAYDDGAHVTGILLTRGLVESVGALNELHHLVTRYEAGNSLALDERLMRLLLGSRSRDDRPDPINVLSLIDRLSKRSSPFRKLYEELSEYAHPNDMGTTYSFARVDARGRSALFGPLGEDAGRRAWLLIECLATTLMLVPPLDAELVKHLPAFISHCESDINARSAP